MVEIWLPYGTSEIPVRIPEERLIDILEPERQKNIADPLAGIKHVIESNGDFLEAAKRAERLCLVLGPSSNGQLTSTITNALVSSLSGLGVSSARVSLLRTTDAPQLDLTLGEVRVSTHDPFSTTTVPFPDSKWNFPVTLNSIFAEADLRIILGELKPHHFFGHTGLSDIVFPGLASRESALSQLTDRRGIAVSDLHRERVEIANSFKSLFAFGFVLDVDLLPVKFVLGRFQDCLENLEIAMRDVYLTRVDRSADIVVMSAGGKPWDESLLNAVETLPAAFPALKRDGVLIVAAECPSGHGNAEFYEWCSEHKEPRYLEARLKHNFNYQGFKATFLLRTLQSHRIHLVSTIPDHYVQNVFGMRPAATVNSALQTVQRSLGSSSAISVIPNASRIILTQAK